MCVYCELWPEDVWCHIQVQAPLEAPSALLITLTAAVCKILLIALCPFPLITVCGVDSSVYTGTCAHTRTHIVSHSLRERASQSY